MVKVRNAALALLLVVVAALGIATADVPAPASAQSPVGTVTELLPTTTITATGSGPAKTGFAAARLLRMHAICTAMGGTSPSYTFALQDSLDGTNFVQLAAATALTANGTAVLTYAEVQAATAQAFADRIRVSYTVSGTSPTASCRVLVYAE